MVVPKTLVTRLIHIHLNISIFNHLIIMFNNVASMSNLY